MAYTPAEWGAAIGAGIGAGGTSAYTGWLIVQKVRSLLGGSNDRRSRTEDEADGADGRSEHGSHPSCVNHTRRLDKLENENKRVEEALTILIQGLKERIERVGQASEEADKLLFEQFRQLSGLLYEVRGVLMGTRKSDDG